MSPALLQDAITALQSPVLPAAFLEALSAPELDA